MKIPPAFKDIENIRNFPAGSVIFNTGQKGEEMYVVESGEVDIMIDGEVVETVQPDGFFGELALIDSETRSTDAIARTDCSLLALNHHRFTFLVDEMPFFAIRVMKVMAHRLRRASKGED